MAGKHSKGVPVEESSPLVFWWRDLVVPQFVSFFEARSALIHRLLVDTRPPAMHAIGLWFSRCLLRTECSLGVGAWSSRAKGFYTLGRA
jgi:hypothetical protein